MITKDKMPKTDSEWLLNERPVIVEFSTQTDVYYWRAGSLNVVPAKYFVDVAVYQGQG
jgi:hypothetical protein